MFSRVVWSTALAVVILDQVTKAVAVVVLEHEPPIALLGNFLQLSFARNPGAAFSFGTSATWLFTLIAMSASVLIIRLTPRVASQSWAIIFGCVLGGAVGNLIDRIFRSPGVLRGHVVDFIQLPHYPMFNIADSAISCAAVAGIVLTLRSVPPLREKISS